MVIEQHARIGGTNAGGGRLQGKGDCFAGAADGPADWSEPIGSNQRGTSGIGGRGTREAIRRRRCRLSSKQFKPGGTRSADSSGIESGTWHDLLRIEGGHFRCGTGGHFLAGISGNRERRPKKTVSNLVGPMANLQRLPGETFLAAEQARAISDSPGENLDPRRGKIRGWRGTERKKGFEAFGLGWGRHGIRGSIGVADPAGGIRWSEAAPRIPAGLGPLTDSRGNGGCEIRNED